MKIKQLALPVWSYLNQELCNSSSVWNFRRFWYLYRIQLLKKCWEQDFSRESRPFH